VRRRRGAILIRDRPPEKRVWRNRPEKTVPPPRFAASQSLAKDSGRHQITRFHLRGHGAALALAGALVERLLAPRVLQRVLQRQFRRGACAAEMDDIERDLMRV
jgi:hypothetical protein